jgi:hypothetical protein
LCSAESFVSGLFEFHVRHFRPMTQEVK